MRASDSEEDDLGVAWDLALLDLGMIPLWPVEGVREGVPGPNPSEPARLPNDTGVGGEHDSSRPES